MVTFRDIAGDTLYVLRIETIDCVDGFGTVRLSDLFRRIWWDRKPVLKALLFLRRAGFYKHDGGGEGRVKMFGTPDAWGDER